MPINHSVGGFKFDFGSTVTILTSVASGTDYGKNINNLGVFTGVVLDETKIKLKREPKHISISVSGLEDFANSLESGCGDKCEDKKYYDKCDVKCEDKHEEKYSEKNADDYHGNKCGEKYECKYEHSYAEKYEPDYKGKQFKDDYESNKPDQYKNYCEPKKHGHEIDVKKAQEFLVLSLTCPSHPFNAGQIVWVNVEQIVAFAVACRS